MLRLSKAVGNGVQDRGMMAHAEWLDLTSMLSVWEPASSTQHCHATTPSLRLKMAVVGTDGGW